MNETLTIDEFNRVWPTFPRALKQNIKLLAQHNTERNLCFAQGYIAGLSACGWINDGQHAYASAMINQLEVNDLIRRLVEEVA